MAGFLNQTALSLRQRLQRHVGFSAAVRAPGFTSEAGLLRGAGQFLRIGSARFPIAAMEQITLLGFEPKVSGTPVTVRTTYRGVLRAQLIRTGTDFLELLLTGGTREWILVPLEQIISVEKA